MTASKYIQGMYIWGESTGGNQDGLYRKASWVKGQAVSLHNWTGYFYTMLMSWAACWHVYPYILSNILSNSLSLSLHATSISPPRTPSTLLPPPPPFILTLFPSLLLSPSSLQFILVSYCLFLRSISQSPAIQTKCNWLMFRNLWK